MLSDVETLTVSLLAAAYAGVALGRAIAGARRQRRQEEQIDQEYAEILRRFEDRKRREWDGD